MRVAEFTKYLILTTLVSVAIFYITNYFLPITQHLKLFWVSVVGFVLLSGIIYLLVERSLLMSGGKGILGLVVFNVLLKLVFSFGFVSLYVQQTQPSDKFFLLPFFIAYLTFTIFETWFLNLQARSSK